MATLMQRIRVAARVFRRGLPQPRMPIKSAPYQWPSYRSGKPQYRLNNYVAYAEEGFCRNSLIYDAIMYKVRSKRLAPLRAYTGTIDGPERLSADHPLEQLMRRPNPYQSAVEFEDSNIVYLNLSGNCYIWLDRPSRQAPPVAMYPVRPDRVWIVPNPKSERGSILGYWYVPEGHSMHEGQPILYQDMMHVKMPNPLDALEGLGEGWSPVAPGARSADVDNSATDFIKDFFDRGLLPDVLLSFDMPIDEGDADRVRDKWSDIYGGREGWLKPGVLGHGGHVERLGWNFDELGFDDIDQRNETRVLGPFGVPAVLVGARVGLENATYSNVDGLTKIFWESTFIPELRLFESEYQYYLRSDDAFVMYDTSGVPALQQDVVELTQAAYTQWQMGKPANQAFRDVGLKYEPFENGDRGYLPLSLMPMSHGAPMLEAPPETDEDEDEAPEAADDEERKAARKGWTHEQKQRIYKNIDRTALQWEPKFADTVEQRMREDLIALLAIITKEKQRTLAEKASINWNNVETDWREYYATDGLQAWQEDFMPLVQGVIGAQAQNIINALGKARKDVWDIRNLPGEWWFDEYMLQFSQIIIESTLSEIHEIVAQALAEGWSIQEMVVQLELMWERWLDPNFTIDGRGLTPEETAWFEERAPRYRLENIARTETMRASNAGTNELYRDWGVEYREWLATGDNRTRDSHLAAWSAYSEGGNPGPLPVGEPFVVGGHQMMYPLDGSYGAPLSEICQCRCTTIPVIPT